MRKLARSACLLMMSCRVAAPPSFPDCAESRNAINLTVCNSPVRVIHGSEMVNKWTTIGGLGTKLLITKLIEFALFSVATNSSVLPVVPTLIPSVLVTCVCVCVYVCVCVGGGGLVDGGKGTHTNYMNSIYTYKHKYTCTQTLTHTHIDEHIPLLCHLDCPPDVVVVCMQTGLFLSPGHC